MISDKCAVQGVDGSACIMVLLGKSASGKPLTVFGLDLEGVHSCQRI